MKRKEKSTLKILIGIAIVLIVIPIILFVSNFHSNDISEKISDWGAFGDYFGGIINTTISLISLVVLAYLTYLIGRQSNEENKKINLLIRRLDAYDNLTKFLPILNYMIPETFSYIDVFMYHIKNASDPSDTNYLESKKKFITDLNFFSDFHHFLFSFNLRYGHLFEYDFYNEEYKDLVYRSSEANQFFLSARESFRLDDNKLEANPDFKVLFDKLTEFINSLRQELK